MIKKLFAVILSVSLLFGSTEYIKQMNSTLYVTYAAEETTHPAADITDAQVRNLQKLCKVWGFAKFTHKSFLLGLKDWDEELLTLIPVVRFADENTVNDILYDWFTGLGDDGYLDISDYRTSMLAKYEESPECYDLIMKYFDENEGFDRASWLELNTKLSLLETGYEMKLHQMADMSWINADYLGSPLTSVLSRFLEVQDIDRAKAPAYFGPSAAYIFTNEKRYLDMDYSDSGYRLLGLFRLWNAMEYFFPYMDIADADWNGLLLTYIPKMLEGTDMTGYDLTLASLTSWLHDGHINFYRGSFSPVHFAFESLYGTYFAPAALTEAEGYLVVSNVAGRYKSRCPLLPGDIILRLNGIAVEEVIADMLQYLSYPNEEKALSSLLMSGDAILRQKSGDVPMKIDVLRNGTELSLDVDTVYREYNANRPSFAVSVSHELLENNIGLINPGSLALNEFFDIMDSFRNTDGLIIDLRQYPTGSIIYSPAEYFLTEQLPFAIMSRPLISVPGVFVDMPQNYSGPGRYAEVMGTRGSEVYFEPYFYPNKVVLLMNEQSASNPEYTIMSLRNGPNVTVMGSNSLGTDGNIVGLPLPGGATMWYSGHAVYTTEGGQTQRIGLSPDIYVERTVEGIRDGRDELMEAAVKFILGEY